MSSTVNTIRDLAQQDYKWGFVTEIDEDRVPKGLSEEIVRLISARKGEPAFMLEWRLNALRHWFQLEREQGERVPDRRDCALPLGQRKRACSTEHPGSANRIHAGP